MAPSQNADGNMPVGKAGESHFFIVPSPLEGPAEALRVLGCIVVIISALTEIRMSSKCSQKAERAAVERMCLSESWHCVLMHMVCWFTEPVALMKSPSRGSLSSVL